MERDIFKADPALHRLRKALWLGRTADRFGLLVCGDLPVALSLAGNADGSLVEFARSSAFATLRAELGLTIDGAR